MKKENNELEEKCHCTCGDECNCGDECTCGDECNCECNCECDCCETDLPPIEEKLLLVGLKDEENTEKAIKFLDKQEVDYLFMDLNDAKAEGFTQIDQKIEIPSLLLIQTIVSNVAFGLDEIKNVFKED